MYRGTSQSTALVSGTAALMYDVFPYITPYQVKSFLECSADDISNISNNGTTYSGLIGAGRLNVFRAVQQVQIYVSSISGPQQLCSNQNVNYSVPIFSGATYHWIANGVTLYNGQGGNSILVNTGNSFNGGRVECTITVGNCFQVKSQTLRKDYNCGSGGYYMKVYPNPVSQSENLTIEMSLESEDLDETSGGKRDKYNKSISVKYNLYDPFGQLIQSSTSSEKVQITTHRLRKGIYTIVAIYDKKTLRERVYIE